MEIGISTSCFYPELTELSFERLGKSGIKTIEIFFNTHSEFDSAYISKLKEAADGYGVSVYSAHPYFAGYEHYLFFSKYERRIQEALDYYDYTFERCARLGVKIFSFHGDKVKPLFIEMEAYCEILSKLTRRASQYGITFCQENVFGHRSGDVSFIRGLRDYMRDGINFTLDIKQANRSGAEPLDMLRAMGSRLRHIHINDYTHEQDCLLPGRGDFDYNKLFDAVKALDYNGNMIIEVYSNNYDDPGDVIASHSFLCGRYADYIRNLC